LGASTTATDEEGTVSEEQPERFAPTSGRIVGVIGLLLAAAIVGFGLVDRDSGIADWLIALAALAGVLVWAAVLRPRVSLVGAHLELRNMLETVSIPLAAIEEMALRQLLAVRVGDKRFLCPALGRSRRQLRGRPAFGSGAVAGRLRSKPADTRTSVDYADFVEQRIRQRMEDERAARGIRPGSAEQLALASEVRRQRAWPEIVALAVLAVAVVVTVVV
jgi:hypothetical protein